MIAGILLGTLIGFMVFLSVVSAWMPRNGLTHLFSIVCHQQVERSHVIEGHPFGLCIRCFWLYMGLAMGCFRYGCFPLRCQPSKSLLLCSLFVAGISWIGGWISPTLDWSFIRIASSLMLGFAISQFAVPGIAELLFSTRTSNKTLPFNHEPKRTRPAASDL